VRRGERREEGGRRGGREGREYLIKLQKFLTTFLRIIISTCRAPRQKLDQPNCVVLVEGQKFSLGNGFRPFPRSSLPSPGDPEEVCLGRRDVQFCTGEFFSGFFFFFQVPGFFFFFAFSVFFGGGGAA
jgi:hypothetical protein